MGVLSITKVPVSIMLLADATVNTPVPSPDHTHLSFCGDKVQEPSKVSRWFHCSNSAPPLGCLQSQTESKDNKIRSFTVAFGSASNLKIRGKFSVSRHSPIHMSFQKIVFVPSPILFLINASKLTFLASSSLIALGY